MNIVTIYLSVILVPLLVLGAALGLEQVERTMLGARELDVVKPEPHQTDVQTSRLPE